MSPRKRDPEIDRLLALAEDIETYTPGLPVGHYTALAMGIVDHPQRHVNGLAKAGVLVDRSADEQDLKQSWWYETDGGKLNVYTLAAPHIHEWRVTGAPDPLRRWVTVTCACGEKREKVPSKLPIEVPS